MKLHQTVIVLALTTASATAQTTRISVATGGVQGNSGSFSPALSDDTRFVAFFSEATNLVPNDTNGADDIFVRDRRTRTTARVSVDSFGGEANGDSYSPAISGDGRFVAFYSEATNLVPGDTNGVADVFVHDRATGATTRISVDSNGLEGNGASYYPSVSTNGRYVAFHSQASNLAAGDTNGFADVFVRDLLLGTTTCASVTSAGAVGNDLSESARLSGDGLRVVFISRASDLVAGDGNGQPDVFVRDLASGTTVLASVDSYGVQGDRGCSYPAISRDGAVVTFESWSTNLVAGDTNDRTDCFVHELASGLTTRVSLSSAGGQADGLSLAPTLSADGRFVAFKSVADNLVPGDTNGAQDIFWHDRVLGTTVRVNLGPGGVQAAGSSSQPLISSDGRHVAYYSSASNLVLGDTNGEADVFFR